MPLLTRLITVRVAAAMALAFIMALSASRGVATPRTWTGAIDTDWFNAGNWDGGVVPDGASEAIVNAPGTVLFTSATQDGAALKLTNAGSLTVQARTLTIGAGGLTNTGALALSGGVLDTLSLVQNGTFLLSGGRLKGATITGSASRLVDFSNLAPGAHAWLEGVDLGATLSLNGAGGTLHLAGTTSASEVTFETSATGTIAFDPGFMPAAGAITVTGIGAGLLNQAEIVWTGNTALSVGSITNDGRFEVTGPSIQLALTTGDVFANNAGRSVVTANGANSAIESDTIVNEGILSYTGGATGAVHASTSIANAGVISAAGALQLDIASGGALDNSGQITVDASLVSVQASDVLNEGAISAQGVASVFVNADGSVTNQSGATLSSRDVGTLVGIFAGDAVTNEGTVAARDGGTLLAVANTIENSGTIEATGGGTVQLGAYSGSASNTGTVRIGKYSFVDVIGSGGPGTLDSTDGVVEGAGALRAHLHLEGGGLKPGDDGTTDVGETLFVGDDTAACDVTQTGGEIRFRVESDGAGGWTNDVLRVDHGRFTFTDGSAWLTDVPLTAGTVLNLIFASGGFWWDTLTVASGTTHVFYDDIAFSNGATGVFRVMDADGGGQWLQLQVAPESGAWQLGGMLATGGLWVGWRRRRRA